MIRENAIPCSPRVPADAAADAPARKRVDKNLRATRGICPLAGKLEKPLKMAVVERAWCPLQNLREGTPLPEFFEVWRLAGPKETVSGIFYSPFRPRALFSRVFTLAALGDWGA